MVFSRRVVFMLWCPVLSNSNKSIVVSTIINHLRMQQIYIKHYGVQHILQVATLFNTCQDVQHILQVATLFNTCQDVKHILQVATLFNTCQDVQHVYIFSSWCWRRRRCWRAGNASSSVPAHTTNIHDPASSTCLQASSQYQTCYKNSSSPT